MFDQKISRSMLEQKRCHAGLEVKSVSESGVFTGYASVFDVADNQRDIIQKGAFSGTLSGNAQIRLLWQHRQEEPIGVIEEIFEDTLGLYIKGRLLLEVARAREAYALLKSGAIGGLSIGYSPVRYRYLPDTGERLLTEIALWEVSLVTFPANAQAKVSVVKSEYPEPPIDPSAMVAFADAVDRALWVLRG